MLEPLPYFQLSLHFSNRTSEMSGQSPKLRLHSNFCFRVPCLYHLDLTLEGTTRGMGHTSSLRFDSPYVRSRISLIVLKKKNSFININRHCLKFRRIIEYLQQQHVDLNSRRALEKGHKQHADGWDASSKARAHMFLHLPHAEGGFGVTFNDVTKDIQETQLATVGRRW